MAHYSGTMWRVKDTTERVQGRRKVLSVGGKIRVGWNDPNHIAKSYPPIDSQWKFEGSLLGYGPPVPGLW